MRSKTGGAVLMSLMTSVALSLSISDSNALRAENIAGASTPVINDSVGTGSVPSVTSASDGEKSARADCRDSHWLAVRENVWGVRAGVVALHRSTPDSAELFYGIPNTAENLDASDFDFDYRVGLDLSVIRRFDCLPNIEIRYLTVNPWNAQAMADDIQFINTRDPIALDTSRNAFASYDSQLHSLELNLRSAGCGRLTWLAGFRYLELDEGFHADLIDATNSSSPVTYDVATRNRLYGAQAGLEAALLNVSNRLRLDAVAKAGVFGNSGAQTSGFATDAVALSAVGSVDKASFVGEANLVAVYCLTGNLSLRASYGVMGITDMVLASDQINATSFIFSDGINDDGGLFYHGGQLGLEYAY